MSGYTPEGDEQGPGMGSVLAQLPTVMWQRRWFVLVPAVLGVLAATATAFLLPTQYRSSATMLVQSPSLPEDVIGGDAPGAIDRRIEAIRQQLINRPRLVAMIEENALYPGEREDKPLSVIIEDMRDAITLVPEQIDLGSNRREERTISVRLAFEYEDASKAQAVTQQLMERVLELNSSTNTIQLTQTVQFLTDQQATLQRRIDEAEAEIAALNARYGGVIASASGSMIGGNAMTYDMQIAGLERDNAGLKTQRRNLESADNRDPSVIAAEARLAATRALYSDTHPDVIIARRLLAEARQLAKQNIEELPVESIDRQIAFNDNQIATLRAARARDVAQAESALAQRSRVPVIEQQAAQMQQRLEGFYNQFRAISDRLLAARAGARADEEQMGERLLVIDPPVVPDRPASPDRPLIIAIGFASGLGLGLLLALAVELFLRPIRDPAAIAAVTGARPLAMVPLISTTATGAGRGWFRGGRRTARRRSGSRWLRGAADG